MFNPGVASKYCSKAPTVAPSVTNHIPLPSRATTEQSTTVAGGLGDRPRQLMVLYLHLVVLGGVVDGTLAVLVDDELGAVSQQPAHHLHMSAAGGEVQGCCAVPVTQVRVHALVLDLRQTYGVPALDLGIHE